MHLRAVALAALLLPSTLHAQTDPNAPQGKLPAGQVKPIAYRLDLTILPDQDRFSGHTEIDATLLKPAALLYMHGRDLKVSKATATIDGRTFPVSFHQVTPTGAARLDFGRTVPAGKVTLNFDYDAAFGSDPSGLYHIKVGDEWYSWSQFESIDARSAFPSFDEPGFKTPFTVSLTTKKGYVAASNAPETGTSAEGALVKHSFMPTLPLPTYLVAFVVGPFATAHTVVPPTPQRKTPLPLRVIATQPNAGKLDYAVKESGRIVALLEKYFGQPFPYPKLDQIASPVMPGAMENAGADIYGDSILLLGPNATTPEKSNFGMVVAHELSHQWFGDLVTPAWWDDIWLNESFANWMGYRIGDEWRPELKLAAGAIDEALTAMGTDALKAGRPIHQIITRDNQIDSAFDQITYGKGGQVVAMIAAYLGDEKFKAGVRLHMARHKYGNASTDDFFASLAAAAKDPRVLASLRGFIDQQGVPVVTLHRQGTGFVASQAPYSFLGATPGNQQWIVPVCLRHGATKRCTLLDKPSMVLAAPGSGALMPNAGGAGYYRFDLDDRDWDALIDAAPRLAPGEALALTDSLWASFYAGHAPFAKLLTEARTITANPYSEAAIDGGARLRGLISRGVVPEVARPALRSFIADLYRPMLAKLGFDPGAGAGAKDSADQQNLRQSVVSSLAFGAHDAEVRTRLLSAADAYLGGDKAALDPAFLGPGLTVAVQERGLPFAKTLVDKALASEDPGFRRAALGATSGAGDKAIAEWLLRDFTDKRLRSIERLNLTTTLIGDPATRDFALDHLITRYDEYVSGNGIFQASRIPGAVAGLCSLEHADAVEKKLGPAVAKAGVGQLALDRAIERIRNCARLKVAKADEIGKTLAATH